jgi:hypothetical protein
MTDPNPIYTELLAEREAVDAVESEVDHDSTADER